MNSILSALGKTVARYLNKLLGPLALQYLLSVGGSGYFRTRVVEQYLNQKRLLPVPCVPEFTYPLYAVYPTEGQSESLTIAIQGARDVQPRSQTGVNANWVGRSGCFTNFCISLEDQLLTFI